MVLPDHLLLSQVQLSNVHYDIKSEEKAISYKKLVKPKYKLAGHVLRIGPHSYFTFFVLTKNKDACRRDLRICFLQVDWEDKNPRYLRQPISYTDLTRCEAMDEKEVLSKIKDCNNRFIRVARLRNSKLVEMIGLLSSMRATRKPIPPEKKTLAEMALVPNMAAIAQDWLKKFGL